MPPLFICIRAKETGNVVTVTEVSLLPTVGKVLARLLLIHLLTHLEHGLLPESQCGFQEGCGTVDMVFAA